MTAQPIAKSFLPSLQRPATTALAIQREFNRLFDDLAAGWNSFAELQIMPRMDVQETKSAVELTLELPGIALNDIKIEFEDDVLTISGEKKSEKEIKEKNHRVSERAYGAFSRSVPLPRSVDADKIKASMADGVLTIVAPKNGVSIAKAIKVQAAK
ncbi:heat-shock protein Hsp20 [Caulobacter sp. Root1455]|jgi:HSP20 family protein|uniref:Hsp20/alpha crystallin family protein n=1 Tax=Caulobacter sp. Root1455 TaxID=1736465 RepID=UPI0006FD7B04|nr:Hsp20/alpha crystallin family protein [Caulobacter sp. Root1455]KQY95125.1 heat-shock protein Hsp20 [Caulobacter sp. Root1455]